MPTSVNGDYVSLHRGLILPYLLLPARPHDRPRLDDLIAGFEGRAAATKAFLEAYRHERRAGKRNGARVTPVRKNMKPIIKLHIGLGSFILDSADLMAMGSIIEINL